MEVSGAIVFLPRGSGGEPPLLFARVLLCPAAVWLVEALKEAGVRDFLAVCHTDDMEQTARLFPQGTALVTTDAPDGADRLSAFLTGRADKVLVVTQPILLIPDDGYAVGPAVGAGDEGLWAIGAPALLAALGQGRAFTAALREHGTPGPWTGLPLSPPGWTVVDNLARQHSVQRLLAAGARVLDPNAVYADPTVTVGPGTVLLPGTILRGNTVIGAGCEIGPNAMITDCTIGDGVTVNASQLNESTVEDGAKIGPFAYIRPRCHVGRNVKVGDFVELKNSVIGDGTKISHLTYVGDSDVGSGVNFGCGTVTVNYDGSAKFRTTIGDNAFIGCNTNLVAPVRVGAGAYTAAGSTITDDVPDDSLAIARSPQTIKVQWAAKRRKAKK